MSVLDIFKKKVTVVKETTSVTKEMTIEGSETSKSDEKKDEKSLGKVAPKSVGVLDMIIAFDTTGSMAAYIGAVRKEVSELIPRLFKDNEDLRLGIVAFGDYCDMKNAQEFGEIIAVLEEYSYLKSETIPGANNNPKSSTMLYINPQIFK